MYSTSFRVFIGENFYKNNYKAKAKSIENAQIVY